MGVNYYNEVYTSYTSDGALEFRIPLFIVSGIIFITIISSSYFAHLGQKGRAFIDLMIPASTFEKLLAGLFYTIFLGIFAFLVVFYLTDLAFITKLRTWYSASGRNMYLDGNKVNLSAHFPYFSTYLEKGVLDFFIVIPFLLTSIYLLGSVYFNKFHYIKTTVILMLFSGIWTALIVKSGQVLFENRSFIETDSSTMFNLKHWVESGMLILLIFLTLVFWFITYVRLKEKEV